MYSQHFLDQSSIDFFSKELLLEEKSGLTIQKYLRDAKAFLNWIPEGSPVTKDLVIRYKNHLAGKYAVSSVNSMLAALNCLFNTLGWIECRVKPLKLQRQMFYDQNKELTKAEYLKLLTAAKMKNDRLYLLIQTICSTGIRVSELKYITVKSARMGYAVVVCKGKIRTVFLSNTLCAMLLEYCARKKIKSGSIFISSRGKPLDRSNIWSEMKKLGVCAGVPNTKIFPHNLRHLFARTYYAKEKDLSCLADILGHSDINTTRIYTRETGATQAQRLTTLELIVSR